MRDKEYIITISKVNCNQIHYIHGQVLQRNNMIYIKKKKSETKLYIAVPILM